MSTEQPESTDSEGADGTSSRALGGGFGEVENDGATPDEPLSAQPVFASPGLQIDKERLRNDTLAAQARCTELDKELKDSRERRCPTNVPCRNREKQNSSV